MTLSNQEPGFYACWVYRASKGFFINHVISPDTANCVYSSYDGPTFYSLDSLHFTQSYWSIVPISDIEPTTFDPSNYPELFI